MDKSRREASHEDAVTSARHMLGAGAVLIFAFVFSLWEFELIWNRSALMEMFRQPGGWPAVIVIVAVSAVIHESLHGFAWRVLAGVPWRSISFRPTWQGLGFAAILSAPVPVRAYRIGMALPTLVLSVLPITLGLATGIGLFVLWGQFFLLECVVDIAALFAMIRIPAHAQVCSHPDKPGCQRVMEADASR